jgi:aspartyl protease family protein
MRIALIGVLVAGAGIGLLLPQDKGAVMPSAPAPAADGAAAAVTASRPAASPARASWGGETRLSPGPGGHFHTTALVNGQPVEFIVDTGATAIALTIDDARRIGIPVNEGSFEVVGSGASGPVRGQLIMLNSVSVDGKEVRTVRGAVLEGLGVSLLGQAYLSRISEVKMSNGEMILR